MSKSVSFSENLRDVRFYETEGRLVRGIDGKMRESTTWAPKKLKISNVVVKGKLDEVKQDFRGEFYDFVDKREHHSDPTKSPVKERKGKIQECIKRNGCCKVRKNLLEVFNAQNYRSILNEKKWTTNPLMDSESLIR